MTEQQKALALAVTTLVNTHGAAHGFFVDDMEEEMENALNALDIEESEAEQNGGEGEGEHYNRVVKFTQGDTEVYFDFYGSYSSYGGTEYEGFNQVEPREVLVTQFFAV